MPTRERAVSNSGRKQNRVETRVKCLIDKDIKSFDVELRLSPRWIGGDIGSTDATKTRHTLNAYIFETNNRKVINNTSLDSL
jgi:hypothetical protein